MDNITWRDFSFSGNYINGRFVIPEHPGFYVEKRNPSDLSELTARIPVYYPHCDEAVERACNIFPEWASIESRARFDILKRLKNSIEMLSSWLVELIARELGRPIWDAKQEIKVALHDMNTYFETLESYSSFSDEEILRDSDVVELYKPIGVVAIVAPFNQPVLYPLRSIVSSLLLGNTVVYKPSEHCPLVGQVLAEAVHNSEIPKGVFNMVHGEKEISKRLITHRKVASVFFSGTFETATKVSRYISEDYWKILIMGTGGKNAGIVMPDCNFNTAVTELLLGSFISSGQRSNGIRRIFVHSQIADRFIDEFHAKAKKLKVGHPLDEYKGQKPFMGPLISEQSMQNYLRLQGIGQREGAEILMRGKEIEVSGDYKGYYVTPSINITDQLKEDGIYNTSEIFGPNVAIKRFDNIGEVVASHNTCDYGYGLSIFTNSRENIARLVRECDVGQIYINTITFGESVKYPIAGYGRSGNSRPEGSLSSFYLRKPLVLYKRDSVRENVDLFPYKELGEL
ncbi:MAG: aldehyde dehydrogenase family protein [Oligoflexia bacterium]|nr:aldehyde dehydrogenase family protein [Oligoflexia bacterium]